MFKLILSLSFLIVGVKSAKILGVLPTPSISHQVVFHPVMQELAKLGHEVTVITTDPAFSKGKTPQNITEIDLHDISYAVWHQILEENGKEKNPLTLFKHFGELPRKLVKKQLETTVIQEFLQSNKKFDLIFVESCMRPALIFSYIYNAPVIEFSSLGGMNFVYDVFGAETHPLIYPDALHRRTYNLTIWEKIKELYIHYSAKLILAENQHAEDVMLKNIFGPDIPSLDDIRKKVHLLFLNIHPIWDLNRPVPPNVVYLGGLHQKTQRDLPLDLKSYLDSSKNGVIYISFGTNVKPSIFPAETLKIFTDVFSKLPYDVLMKWDNDELPGRSKNVRISKWFPQSDMLRHPKIKLFITQGGLQSTDEAITAGVPLVGVPIYGDQWFNTDLYVKLNIGKRIVLETLTEDELTDVIKTVVNNNSYRQNIIKLRNMMHDQPQKPLERAVWWTEYVLRHGGLHLRAPGADISWTEYYELKLVFLLLAAFLVVLIITILAMYFIISNIKYYIQKRRMMIGLDDWMIGNDSDDNLVYGDFIISLSRSFLQQSEEDRIEMRLEEMFGMDYLGDKNTRKLLNVPY
ncbi:unnamed protein product [Euphydryas editha]|uniref:Glucuronosyltransferase n=1 Tax=Euphydryas editha TaxID=104508 RepID=A0AAU9UKL4_EUPED|nr:unnamed protein product [Euphydryas editha]